MSCGCKKAVLVSFFLIGQVDYRMGDVEIEVTAYALGFGGW